MDAHSKKTEIVFSELKTSARGLSEKEAERRLEEYGKNAIEKDSSINPWKIFIAQFKDFLIIIMILAAAISYAMSFLPGGEDHLIDSILIGIILIANAIIGFVQEYRAEKGILALKKLSAPKAIVLRDGSEKEIPSELVVPGDILILEQGDKIPADARLVEHANLEVDESTLTGESLPVIKQLEVVEKNISLADRTNMVFMDTIVTKGRARAIVTGTGMKTELGKIAEQIAESEEKPTPFQIELDKLGKKIGIGIIFVIAIVAGIQAIFVQGSPLEIFLTAISLAVAAVPEGLPAIVTLALTIGVRKMSKKNALARKLPVAESLGSVNAICTDKTGTLTENVMTVKKIFFDWKEFDVSGEGHSIEGNFTSNKKIAASKELRQLLSCGVQCNDSVLGKDEKGKSKYLGDPTETALLISAQKAGIDIKIEKGKVKRINEIPFSSDRKMMTVICRSTSKKIAYSKGAPEIIIEKCTHTIKNGKKVKLSPKLKRELLDKNAEFGKNALRVLGFAARELNGKEKEIEKEMVFLGMQGMIDPPRTGVLEAIQDCRDAGIKVIMVTGDNINTAKAIGKQLGFTTDYAVSGMELDEMSEAELTQALKKTEVFARVSPAHKVKILEALQDSGKIVAMTGDGVNDAPALKRSDVGIAMGIRGTDVAKETSDMILLDDNFVTIRDAVAEGRGIFDNIKKFVNYLLSSNVAEVLVVLLFTLMAIGIYFGEGAVILTAAQLLWINLLTDGLPAIALGLDPKAKNIMDRKPRKKSAGVIDTRMIYSIITIGIAMAVVILAVFMWEFTSSNAIEKFAFAQTTAFTCFVVFEMVRVQTVRSYFNTKLTSNKWLWMAVGSSFALHLLLLYTPLSDFFRVMPLGLDQWTKIIVGALAFVAISYGIVKVEKLIFGKME